MRGRVKSPEIILVQIDDRAFTNLGEKQPLPRSYIAGLIDVLSKSGAKVIGVEKTGLKDLASEEYSESDFLLKQKQ
jgi:CHASE2 domain-containing sensor protein